MGTLLTTPVLTDKQFEKISSLVYEICGINLHVGKKQLANSRLSKRLRILGMSAFDEYLEYLAGNPQEVIDMLDAISTNLTSFFREPQHFDHLSKVIIPRLVSERGRDAHRRLRIWSAACSSGEEPYTIAIVIKREIEDLDRWDAAVLATDINTRMLETGKRGEYEETRLKTVPPAVRQLYFDCIVPKKPRRYKVKPEIRKLVAFARLNLLEDWPMRGKFDVIFCRNTMIYFDKPTQSRLVNRYYEKLNKGGTLFIGHSESLTGIKHQFKYIKPTVYEKARAE